MYSNKLLLLTGGLVLFFSSCVKEQISSPAATGNPTPAMTKVVRMSDKFDNTSLLVKMQSADRLLLEQIESLPQVLSVSKVFNSTPENEALEAEFGLDRWYMIVFDESADINALAAELSAFSSVNVVQYNSLADRASDCKTYPYYHDGLQPVTKADSYPFNDPSLPSQWHYINNGNASIAANVSKLADIDVASVWRELTCGDPSIVVAVVDEGVKYTHPDLKDNMWVNQKELNGTPGVDDDGNGYVDDIYGYNFVDKRGDISWGITTGNPQNPGDSGHGTHCAGTIAAVNNNNVGVSGVAGGSGKGDGCRIMSCQIFSGGRGGSASISANAIKYAADNGASIISCSFGYSHGFKSDDDYVRSVGSVEIDAIHYFEAKKGNNSVLTDGNIAIFAAGNDSHPYAHYPGAYHDIISVSAFGPDYLPTYYTNYGPGCNITAPGGEYYLGSKAEASAILSTLTSEVSGSDYGYMQGTSMACPHVSGVVALGLSYAKKLGKTFTRERFKQMILASANDIDKKIGSTQSKKYYQNAMKPLPMTPYYHKMGTGAIDTWQLMMQIEGVPCLTAEAGVRQWVDLSGYFGSASVSLTYLGVEIDEASRASLGIIEEPELKYGRLYIHPTKTGSGRIKVTAVGGGDAVGGGSRPTGGMEISQDIAIVARSFKASNGGWL